ncbi:MAG TPA: DUF4433 domain-containing protein [Allosphingosinicella sp.]|nr:DUF4433 domain-containing protein [Allosphingosinicella sp.]
MAIPMQYRGKLVYHFTHRNNLEHILRHGFVAKNHPEFPKHVRSVAAETIQERRSTMPVPCGPRGLIHDYVPLYFGSLSPMLLAVVKTQEVDQADILYFEFPIDLIDRADVVFTDKAANATAHPAFYEKPADLARIDWDLVDSRGWGEKDPDRKRRRMAEVLVHWQLPLNQAVRCVAFDAASVTRAKGLVGTRRFPPIEQEQFERPHFYKKFWEDGSSL